MALDPNKASSLDTCFPYCLCICVCMVSLHPCVSVRITKYCLVAKGNSCYWGFLYWHVNKGEPPRCSLVCPPAYQIWDPCWAQPVDAEEGRDSAPCRGGNSSKAQSFESGTGRDSRALTKTLPLWVNGTSPCFFQTNGFAFWGFYTSVETDI